MRIDQNSDAGLNPLQNQDSVVSERSEKKKENITSVSGANLKGASLLEQRKGIAREQAYKVVADAFARELKLDTQMQSIKDGLKEIQDKIYERTQSLQDFNEKIEELNKMYGINSESEEAKMMYENYMRPLYTIYDLSKLSDDDLERITEYRERFDEFLVQKELLEIDNNSDKMKRAAYVDAYKNAKIERLKSQDMLKAQNAAEDILEALNGEEIALLTQEAIEHVDEEQKEREEEAKEASEKKKEEKKKEAKKLEKEALQQEMLENIKEHAQQNQRTSADIKRAIAREKRQEATQLDAEDISKTIISDSASMEDTQDAVNHEITNILNKLSLLADDVKGSKIDDQV